MTAKIVRFPAERCFRHFEDYRPESAMILILPVIRIEYDDRPGRHRRYPDPLAEAMAEMMTAFDVWWEIWT